MNSNPPRLARWLLRRTLDGAARSAIVGDLDEEFARYIVPQLGVRRAGRWYWRQTVLSLAACLRGKAEQTLDPDRPSLTNARNIMQDGRGLGTDFRAAVRFCVRSPMTSAAVILTLAVGVGANTAMFSVLNAAFLKQLPIANAERLVSVDSGGGGSFTYPEYLASRDAPGLTALLAGGRTSVMLGTGDSRQRVAVEMVTANYFDALGVPPAPLGRLLQADDDLAGRAPVAVLSYEFWYSQLDADPALLGTTVKLNRAFFTIAGVAPRGFTGIQIGYGPDLWVPLTRVPLMENNPAALGPGSAWLGMSGILENHDSLEVAKAALAGRWQALGQRYAPVLQRIPRGHTWWSPGPDTRLRVVGLFVILILVIACLNVSTLLGATVHERQKELAIRASLGAGRLRLLRQLLAEQLLLAAAAGVLGGIAGVWVARGLATLMASDFTPGDLDVSFDRNVLLFTLAVSTLTGLAVGTIPALRWSQVNVQAALQGATHSGLQPLRRSAGLWWLIPGQVALGTVLLASAGVLVKTVHQLKMGIEATAPDRVWFADLQRDTDTSETSAAFTEFQNAIRAHLLHMPGVEAAGIANARPLASSSRGPLKVEGMTVVPKSQPMPWGPPPPPPPRGAAKVPVEKLWFVSNGYVTPGYFPALGLQLVSGRDFNSADITGSPRVAIVNETLAAHAFGKGHPVGRRVSWAMGDLFDIEIVGVVRDLRSEHLRESAPDAIFFPLAQIAMGQTSERSVTGGMEPINLTLVLRAADGQQLNRDQLARQLLAFDSSLFVDRVRTFDDEAGRTLSQERLLAGLGSVFGVIALVLLVVGLYGTLAAAVARGRRELGIRLALGATPRAVRAMVVTRALVVVSCGLALGLPLAFVFSKSFAHLLYGVKPIEPQVMAGSIVVIATTAIAAAYIPARRAARTDPSEVLR
jgi:predicted permease